MNKKIVFAVVLLILVVLLAACIFRKPTDNNGNGANDGTNPNLHGDWIYPATANDNSVWGIKKGIAFGVQRNGTPPQIDEAPGGTWAPGLLYIMWTDSQGKTHFFNYLGFEVLSAKGLDQSEAEKIVFTPGEPKIENNIMTVVFKMSEFQRNKISGIITVRIDKNHPREIEISAQNPDQETDPVLYFHVSATAGNLARLRNLYLKDEVVNSRELFAGMQQNAACFYPLQTFDLSKLPIDAAGNITVYAGNDETGQWVGDWGSATAPFYGGQKFYQYWKKYPGSYKDDLKITVNARDKYFSGFLNSCNGKQVLGGVAYENFDMAEQYFDGQTFWYGYSYERQ